MVTQRFGKFPKTQVLVCHIKAEGINKLAHMFDGTSITAIILHKILWVISLKVWLAKYSQWIRRSLCVKPFLRRFDPFLL